jgi:DNA-binding CsgD family transcriptional regulator
VTCPSCCRHLTPREIQILACTAGGMTARQIASALSISRRTVEFHIAAMLRRSGSSSAVELVARCYVTGIFLPRQWPPAWSGQLCLHVAADMASSGLEARAASPAVFSG